MKSMLVIAAMLLVSPLAVFGEPASQVPISLFGVKLGGIYQFGDNPNDIGGFPIKMFKGMKQFLGSGVHFYFQPLKEYQGFPYVEKKKKPDDQYFETSYRLYLLPVYPKDTKDLNDAGLNNMKWEVAVVEWSESGTDTEEDKDNAYYWAMDFCATLQADQAKKPEIINYHDTKWYECRFKEKSRVLYANSIGGSKNFGLKFVETIFDNSSVPTLIE